MTVVSEGMREAESEFKEILLTKQDMVAKITINRPKVYNAYSATTLKEIAEAFDTVSDDDSTGVAILTMGSRQSRRLSSELCYLHCRNSERVEPLGNH